MSDMNRNEIRITIAKACGWEDIHNQPFTDHLHCHYDLLFGTPRYDGQLVHDAEQLPDYPNDLNAMHEAEKMLTPKQRNRYNAELRSLCADIDIWHATAAQRAEAFCRAINQAK
jgi:hypothetical protein